MAAAENCIFDYFENYASEEGDSLFLFNEDRKYTVSETFREAISIANRLYDAGIRAGSLAALRSTRSLDAYLIFLALEFLGAEVVLTDPHEGAEDFLRDSGIDIRPDFVITNERARKGTSADGEWEITGHGELKIGNGAAGEKPRFEPQRDICAPAVVVFTSASTGKSKASILSQQALLQYAEDSIVKPWHLPGDIAIVTLPTQHGFALCLLIAAFVARYALFFPREMGANYVLDAIEKYRITRINGVPSYFFILAREAERKSRDLTSLKTGFSAGAPIIPEQHRYIERTLGIKLHPLYGMSECISISCTAPSDPPEARAETVGRLHRGAGVIVDRLGNELANGQEGEICVFGPAIMLGYYGDEAATKRAIDEKGHLHTGDLGYIDGSGYLRITGRIKDIIIRNGINLSPARIEAAIRSLSEVEAASVVGVRDELVGEAPCALVVLREGCQLKAEELRARLDGRLRKNEIPARVKFSSELPLNGMGKPDKRRVRELFEDTKD